ncbi:MAG: M20/M25/M40 family metallo-hydrolase [Planctomycetota bacterium]
MNRKTSSPSTRTRKSAQKNSNSAAEKLVIQLMGIPGASGDEVAVADVIRNKLIDAGAKPSQIKHDTAHKKTPIDGEIGNLIFKLSGTAKGPRRLLMAHMDTVPICVGCKPKKSGRIVRSSISTTGLGADNRAGCAVVLNAAMHVLKSDTPHPPLTFLFTVQEEIGLHGARHVRKSMLGSPKLCFNWDGGSPSKLTIGATGGYRMLIEISGLASHAGNAPERGVSAIAIASLAIADLHRNGWHGQVEKNGKSGTTNVGVINGGAATNVVTDHVTLRAEARSHDPVFRKRIVKEIEKAFQSAVKEVRSEQGKRGKVTFQGRLDYEAFRMDRTHPTVETAAAAVKAVGGKPQFAITNGGLDANWMSVHGLPTVSMGCGQKNQHMVTEELHLDEYLQACEIGRRLAMAE